MSYQRYESAANISLTTASIPAATGDGTDYTLIPDNVSYDYLSEYNNMTGGFTPNAVYGNNPINVEVNAIVAIGDLVEDNTKLDLSVYLDLGGGPQAFALMKSLNPFPIANPDGSLIISGSVILRIPATGTAFVVLNVSGNSSANVSITGDSSALPLLTSLSFTRIP